MKPTQSELRNPNRPLMRRLQRQVDVKNEGVLKDIALKKQKFFKPKEGSSE